MSENAFKSEGIELRIKQKAVEENVVQSNTRGIDYTASPRIFLGDDGRLYFRDNLIREPVPLSKIDNFYRRIKIEDSGELRFYDEELESSVSLSQVTINELPISNANTVIESKRKIFEPLSAYSVITIIEDKYRFYESNIDADGSAFSNLEDRRDDFYSVFTNDKLRLADKEIFDVLVEGYTYGLDSESALFLAGSEEYGFSPSSTLEGKDVFINDDVIGFYPQDGDLLGKKYFAGRSLSEFDDYLFQNLYRYNGVGKFIEKVFGPNTASDDEVYREYEYLEDGYTTIRPISGMTVQPYIINAVNNAKCGSGYLSGGPVTINGIEDGFIVMKITSTDAIAVSGQSAGVSVPYVGCSDTNTIGSIECDLGRIKYQEYNLFEVDGGLSSLDIWFNDFDINDNAGSANIDFYFTRGYQKASGIFNVNAQENVIWYNSETGSYTRHLSGDPDFSVDTDTKFVGAFPAGTLTITPISGGVIVGSTSSFNYNEYSFTTSVSANDGVVDIDVGTIKSNLGTISYTGPTVFDITTPTAFQVWYDDVNNADNQGEILFSYAFVPSIDAAPTIEGDGYFKRYGSFGEFQNLIIQDISKGFTNVMIEKFVENFNSVLLSNNFLNGFEFKPAEQISENASFSSLLAQVDSKMVQSKSALESEFFNMLDLIFSEDQSSIINYSDGSTATLGGYTKDKLYNIDFSKFNNRWFDIDGFYVTTQKISNETGMAVLASMNLDILHKKRAKFEFRLFESSSQQELDRITIETAPSSDGDTFRQFKETVPVQLSYIGPSPLVTCTEESFSKCIATSNLDVNSHVRVNATSLYSTDAVSDKYAFMADNLQQYDLLAKNNDDINYVDLKVPRVIRVQWRMIMPDDYAGVTHSNDISDIRFEKSTDFKDDFEMSVSLYDFEKTVKKNVRHKGVASFNKLSKKRIELDFMIANSSKDYSINLECSRNINVWYEDKTSSGFTIVAEKDFEGEVVWVVSKQPNFGSENDGTKETATELPPCYVDYKPKYAKYSNFDYLTLDGYFAETTQEDQSLFVGETGTEDISGVVGTGEGYYVDLNGPNCSTDCVNDCPDGYYCSNACPDGYRTESGCACCECYLDDHCPEGYECSFGECIPVV